MCNCGICNFCDLVITTLLGIVLAVLVFFFPIPGILIGVGITLALSAIILFLTVGLTTFLRDDKLNCLCNNVRCLLVSTIGTIIATIIALSIFIILPGSLAIAILFFFIGLFATLMLFTFARLITCLACRNL